MTKFCKKCNAETERYPSKSGRCIPCTRAHCSRWEKENPAKRKAMNRASYQRNREKALAAGAKYRTENPEKILAGNKHQYQKNREARTAYSSAQYRANPDAARDANLRRKFGFGLQEYRVRLANQGGRCALCSATDAGGAGAFHVDHDHSTGAVRDLLCSRCNTGIGLLGDDPERLRRAAVYIERHRVLGKAA